MGQTEAPDQQSTADGRVALIYAEHASSVRRRCFRLTGNAAAADDLTQEVFARFLARFEELPENLNVPGYLVATAHNIWVNQLRKEGNVRVTPIDESGASDDRLENDPVRTLLLAEQRADVQRSAAGLTERQRRALALRELEGRSYGEIGAEMGLGTNAVAQVVWRARTQLRRSLRRSQIDVDRLADDCRGRLDAMSDLVDRHASSDTADLEAHIADCKGCRSTLAAYQEVGWRLRGAVPFVPLVAIMARVGTALRASVEVPAGIGTAAAVTAAVVATAGGGGVLAAHSTASAGSGATASHTLVRRASSASGLLPGTPAKRVIAATRRRAPTQMSSHVQTASLTIPVAVTTSARTPGPPTGGPRPIQTPAGPPPGLTSQPARPPEKDTTAPGKAPAAAAKTPPGQRGAHEKSKTPPPHANGATTDAERGHAGAKPPVAPTAHGHAGKGAGGGTGRNTPVPAPRTRETTGSAATPAPRGHATGHTKPTSGDAAAAPASQPALPVTPDPAAASTAPPPTHGNAAEKRSADPTSPVDPAPPAAAFTSVPADDPSAPPTPGDQPSGNDGRSKK